jgi:hypothetical protein
MPRIALDREPEPASVAIVRGPYTSTREKVCPVENCSRPLRRYVETPIMPMLFRHRRRVRRKCP